MMKVDIYMFVGKSSSEACLQKTLFDLCVSYFLLKLRTRKCPLESLSCCCVFVVQGCKKHGSGCAQHSS